MKITRYLTSALLGATVGLYMGANLFTIDKPKDYKKIDPGYIPPRELSIVADDLQGNDGLDEVYLVYMHNGNLKFIEMTPENFDFATDMILLKDALKMKNKDSPPSKDNEHVINKKKINCSYETDI